VVRQRSHRLGRDADVGVEEGKALATFCGGQALDEMDLGERGQGDSQTL
jgi:hypothetical protein